MKKTFKNLQSVIHAGVGLILSLFSVVTLAATCNVADTYTNLTRTDNFSTTQSFWQAVNFNRSISNWPNESIYNSSNEVQNIAFNINGDLSIQGPVSSGGDNEYGMVEYALNASGVGPATALRYSIYADIDTNATSSTNNDLGIVFGYENGQNYYIARWTAIGTSYSGNSVFPGQHRQLELIKVANGNASTLSSRVVNLGNATSMMLVSDTDGIALCTGSTGSSPSAMQLQVSSSETVALNRVGFYSYDNDVGYDVDNFNFRCQDCSTQTIVPILDYQFDECSYTGSAGDVIDQTGNFNGTSHSLPSPTTDSVINRSADFSDDGRSDWLHLPSNAIDGLDALSISLWFKTPTSKNQQEIFQALGSNTGDDELEIYLRNNNDVEVKIKDSSVRLDSSITLTNDNWHHLVVTRENDNVCLFIDGSLQECQSGQRTGSLSVPNANAVVLGQEQDAFGGGFSTSQNFEGQLDEFKVFNSALNAAAISNIYSNELAGNNYDGSARSSIDCGGLLAFYQFEQDSFSSNIIDSSGNDNHGTNDSGISTDDGKYCRAFDTNGFNNSINTDNAFVSGLDLDSDVGRQGSISFWFNSNNNWNASNERTLFDASCNRQGGCGSDKYFTLEIRSDGRLRFSFEDSQDRDFSFSESSTVSRQADTWYYITATWDYSADHFRVYVDGSQVASSNANTNGAMRDFTNIVFGDNSSSYARSGSSALASTLSANGKFDEVRIYNYPIDSTKIAEDMQDNDCIELIANYQMEQTSWQGSAGEVIDETGNYNATAVNGAFTSASLPAISGNPGTCRYSELDGNNDFIQLPDNFENLTESFTITAWINPSNLDRGSRILIDDQSNTGGYGFSLGDPGQGRLRFYSRRISPISVDTGNVIPTGTWTFVTAVHNADNKTREIYVNGVAQVITGGGTSNTYTGDWGVDTGPASIGGETDRGETANRFTGLMDEVRVYKGALTSDDISRVYQETHPCAANLEFFNIKHDGSGITCMPEPVEILACTDATCNSTDTSITTDVTLQLSNGNTQTVSVVNGVGNTNFNYTDTTTPVELSLSSDYQCENTVSNTTGTGGLPCQLTFSNTGFVFSDIPNQISGVEFSGVTVTALADNNGVCEALITDTTDIGIAVQYQDPIVTTTNEYQIRGTAINDYTTAPPANGYTDIPLTFDNVGTAEITNNNYYDAGQIRLHARVVIPASGVNPAVVVEGNSNQFWVRPHMLDIASSIEGSGIFAAGDDFDLDIIAVNADGNQTFNYEPTDIELAFIRNLPTATGSVDGMLNYGNGTINSSILVDFSKASGITSGFSNGKYSTNSANFSEVGNYIIDVRENNYAGLGLAVEANALVLQRFTPKTFIQIVEITGEVQGIGTCDTWHYSGQPGINYRTTPQLKITAVNTQNEVTQNYRDFGVESGISQDFMRLADDDVTINSPTQDIKDGALGVGNPYLLTGTILTPTNAYTLEDSVYSGGVYLYQLNANDSFEYTRDLNAVTEPFNAEFDLVVASIEDSDGVTASSLVDIELRSAVEVRFGRLVLENSYGPEIGSLPQSFSTEYLSNTTTGTFISNVDDNCTDVLKDDANWTFIDNGGGIVPSDMDDVTGNEGALIGGLTGKERQTALELKSGSIKQGSIGVQYETPDWLKFNWLGESDGLHDNNANAVATFGRFRGNDRIIYWREVN